MNCTKRECENANIVVFQVCGCTNSEKIDKESINRTENSTKISKNNEKNDVTTNNSNAAKNSGDKLGLTIENQNEIGNKTEKNTEITSSAKISGVKLDEKTGKNTESTSSAKISGVKLDEKTEKVGSAKISGVKLDEKTEKVGSGKISGGKSYGKTGIIQSAKNSGRVEAERFEIIGKKDSINVTAKISGTTRDELVKQTDRKSTAILPVVPTIRKVQTDKAKSTDRNRIITVNDEQIDGGAKSSGEVNPRSKVNHKLRRLEREETTTKKQGTSVTLEIQKSVKIKRKNYETQK